METDMRRRDGSLVPVELSMSMWVEEGRSSFGAIVRDIAEFRSNEDRLFRLAHLDPLTELPNRTLLRIRLEQVLECQEAACVMLVGLDGFKDINDSLGYSGGDAVLLQVARRLKASVRPTDMVARMDGDEFAILIPGLDDAVRAAEIADLTIQNVTEMLFIDEQPVYLSASVGRRRGRPILRVPRARSSQD
jgi:diguanylate cyclase (GGDEF)-like protein